MAQRTDPDSRHSTRGSRRVVLSVVACCAALAAVLLSGCKSTRAVGSAVKVKNTSRTFDTVVIDAGHGGHDPGAIGRYRTREKYLALDLAKRLDRELRARGMRTVMTRRGDYFVPLHGRVRISNNEKNAIFVSLHFNYSRSRRVRGMEVFYVHSSARRLASRILQRMLQLRTSPNRGVKRANFHVLRNNKFPAVLIESGFLTHYREVRLCRSSSYRARLAKQIARAILEQRQ